MSAVRRSALMHPFGLSSKVELQAHRIPVHLQFAHVLVFEEHAAVPHRVVNDPNGPAANKVSADERSLANLNVPSGPLPNRKQSLTQASIFRGVSDVCLRINRSRSGILQERSKK